MSGDFPDPPYGTSGRLELDELEDRLLCHVCGGWFRGLAQHARLAHGLTADEYRELAGLNRQTRLVSPGMRAKLRETTAPLIARLRAEGKLRNWREDPGRWARDKAAAVEALREGMRPETSLHRSEALADPDRQAAMAERRRQRNLDGLDRASPEAIRAGLRRVAGEGTCERCGVVYQRETLTQRYCPECAPIARRAYQREHKRSQRGAPEPHHRPAASGEGWDVTCQRCGTTFSGSHAAKYCPACRPEMLRLWKREAKRRERAARKAAAS
jgi:Zn finger protein HypA/HybF involved in hydrogenase expression